jgi:hypothetical protein
MAARWEMPGSSSYLELAVAGSWTLPRTSADVAIPSQQRASQVEQVRGG